MEKQIKQRIKDLEYNIKRDTMTAQSKCPPWEKKQAKERMSSNWHRKQELESLLREPVETKKERHDFDVAIESIEHIAFKQYEDACYMKTSKLRAMNYESELKHAAKVLQVLVDKVGNR